MAQLTSVISYLDSLLENQRYTDVALNGLQVETGNTVIKRVAYAVDSGLSILEQAVKAEADLLLFHHGLFWVAGPSPLRGTFGRKVELLFKHRCSLYASHLPLDGHIEVGNGTGVARFFGLEEVTPFFEHHGATIGVRARVKNALPLAHFAERASALPGAPTPFLLPFGKDKIVTVGVVTGSGSSAITLCAEAGIDLLISGEPKHEAYHLAREARQSALFAGHYATETFGVAALAKRLEKDFDLQTIFIDESSGI